MGRFGPLEPGLTFAGEYRIVAPLQSGGMGAVYVAEQLSTARRRALKVMHPDLVRDPRLERRFELEARIGGRIASPYIVDVIAAGIDAKTGLPWLAMELLEGEDLAAAVARRGLLPRAEALSVLEQLGSALASAHAADVVHRDIKPENVFLTRNSGLKLLDLGIAKCVAAAHSLTLPVGTPLWMAPEQTRHDAVIRPAADVWAFGLLAFWLLAGRHYWRSAACEAVSPIQLLREMAVDALEPAAARAAALDAPGELPAGFDEWFAQAVQIDPRRRFADGQEALSALAPVLGTGIRAARANEGRAPEATQLPRIRSGRSQRAFVGRERELGELHAALDDAIGGHGSVVLVSGEPGIGKTRLLDRFASEAERRGARTHWGRCWEAGGAPSFWPWIQALRELVQERTAETVSGWLGASAVDLAGLLPELSFGAPARAPSGEEDGGRFRLFDSLARLLSLAASDLPILLLLDDLHAADRASLELLHFVARSIHRTRVLVVGTHRESEVRASPELAPAFARIQREASALSLSRFQLSEVALLAARIAQAAPNAELVSSLHRLTEGNPLFVDAVLRLLVSRGELGEAQTGCVLPLPDSVREVIQQRIAVLAPSTLSLLELAAVVGRAFDRALLARLAQLSADELQSELGAAGSSGVLVEPIAGRLEFSHALIRDSLYAKLPPSRRTELHARVFEELVRSNVSAEIVPEELAHHAELAVSAIGRGRAVEAMVKAAEHARSMLAFEDAVLLYERGLALLDQSDQRRRAELLLEAGASQLHAGDAEGGKRACSSAAELARQLRDPELLATAALAYGVELTPGIGDQTLLDLLDEALNVLVPGDGALRARVLARKAAVLQPAPDPARPMAMAREAIAMARRSGDPEGARHVLMNAGSALVYFAHPRERESLDLELLELATRAGDRVQRLAALARLISDALELGNRAAAERHAAAFEDLAQSFRQPRYQWRPALFRSLLAVLDGRASESERWLREAQSIASRAENVDPIYFVMHRLGALLTLERVEQVVELAPEALARCIVWKREHWLEALQAQVAAVSGDLAAVESLLARSDGWLKTTDDPGLLALLVRPCIAVRDRARMTTLLERLSIRHDCVMSFSLASMMLDMPYAWARGALCHELGRLDEAEAHYERASELVTTLRSPVLAAKLNVDRARLLRLEGRDPERAARLLVEAKRAATEIGMPALALRIDRELDTTPATAASDQVSFDLRQEGEYWTIEAFGQLVRLKDSRGLQWLARLIAEPGREIHVLSLVGADELLLGDAGDALDGEAIARYRRRLGDLREISNEAEMFGDAERAGRARAEIDAIAAELSRGVGLSGRSRKSGSIAERARVNVQRRLRDAIRRIGRGIPALGKHLDAQIRTGSYCSYRR